MHLIIDGIAQNKNLLSSVVALARWLMEFVLSIDMRPIGVPYVLDYPGSEGIGAGYEPGLSGCLFLAESSITIHTWPEKGLITLDIYSCKEFDDKEVLGKVVQDFDLGNYGYAYFKRPLDMGWRIKGHGQKG